MGHTARHCPTTPPPAPTVAEAMAIRGNTRGDALLKMELARAEEEAAAERRLQAEVEAAMAASVAEAAARRRRGREGCALIAECLGPFLQAAARQEREVAEEAGRPQHALPAQSIIIP